MSHPPKGTLIRIIESKLLDAEADRRLIAHHGSLWIVQEWPVLGDDLLVWTRSLATGHEHCWFDYEYEYEETLTPDKEQTDGDDTGAQAQESDDQPDADAAVR
jgi:hypothetical protein